MTFTDNVRALVLVIVVGAGLFIVARAIHAKQAPDRRFQHSIYLRDVAGDCVELLVWSKTDVIAH